MRIIVSGGTGFIGHSIIRALLEDGHDVILLSRSSHLKSPGDFFDTNKEGSLKVMEWDGKSLGLWSDYMENTHAVINLTGEPIAAKKWTAAQKEKIASSRLESTKILVQAIAQAKKKPFVLINASAIGYYGDTDDAIVMESQPRGEGFLPETCGKWESQASEAESLGVRVVFLRLGLVLGKGGGVLKKMIPPFNFFLGGPLGTGYQWLSWVHIDDVIGIILLALKHLELSGPVNVTAPNPVNMNQFCYALGRALGRPSWLPVPSWVLKLGLGEMSEMLLTGQRVIPQRLQAEGYVFKHSDIEEALASIIKGKK